MRLAFSLIGPDLDSPLDVLLDVDEEATVGSLIAELESLLDAPRAVAGGSVLAAVSAHEAEAASDAPSATVITGPWRTGSASVPPRPDAPPTLPPVGAGRRYSVNGIDLDPEDTVTASPIVDGCLLSYDAPEYSLAMSETGTIRIQVVGGLGAGAVAWLTPGEWTLGGGGVDLPGLPDLGGLPLTVFEDGAVEVHPVEGRPMWIDGEEVAGFTTWGFGAFLRVGDSVLTVAAPEIRYAAVTASDTGTGYDFNRPPRILPPDPETKFTLPTKPQPPRFQGFPIVIIFLPIVFAIVMVTLLGSMRYAIFAILSPMMMIGNYFQRKVTGKKTYQQEMAEYREKRAKVEADMVQAVADERAHRRVVGPDPGTLLLNAAGPQTALWERRDDNPDYMWLRVGLASLESEVVLVDPDEVDHLRKSTQEIVEVPVYIPLQNAGVVGVAGTADFTGRTAGWLIAQVAALHSPNDVQICVLGGADDADRWSWIRWLPHAVPMHGQDAVRTLGTDTDTLATRVSELSALVKARLEVLSSPRVGESPWEDVVVLVEDARRLRALPGMTQILKDGPKVGVYSICVDREERLLPEECNSIAVQVDASYVRVSQQKSKVVETSLADQPAPGWFNRLARSMSPIIDATDEDADSALPDSCRLLEVMRLEDPDSAGIRSYWSRIGRSTEAVIGMSLDGPIALDIRKDGPHGLVAGTTGSGKSEFLQTLVAALAIVNRPDAMTFVLVDYKGGSAFKDCVKLPHTVGMVTDLDSHLVERALTSLTAELNRREHILADVEAKDIEDYTDLRAKRPELAPLPRLLIVIDEFASMVRDLPDFVTGLVNIAQRGRSLGIHLILATQRPSGVVSPEIRANTNLRVALRVTDKGESTDVIDSPAASTIGKHHPGRGYARLGASTLVPFQAGRVGGRKPGGGPRQIPKPFVSEVGWEDFGRPWPARPKQKVDEGDVEITDLSVLVGAIIDADRDEAIPAQHRPWLDALPEILTLEELDARAGAPSVDPATAIPPVAWALTDRPERQAQAVETIDFRTLGHKFVVGAGRSGRTQAVRTIAGALSRATGLADVHLYGLDCGTGGLLPLTELPHTGAVVLRTQPERARRLLSRLQDEVTRRQELLADGGYASITEQREAAADDARLPHIVFFIDRWEGFISSLSELDNGKLQSTVMSLLSDGASVGIHCIITGDRSLNNFRMISQTEDRLVLRLNERTEYSGAGLVPRNIPEEIPPGRGFMVDGQVETQIAVLSEDLSAQGQAAVLRSIGTAAKERAGAVPRSRRPFRVDVLPKTVTLEKALEFRTDEQEANPWFALAGVGGDDLTAQGADFAQAPVFIIGGPPKSGRSTSFAVMARQLLDHGKHMVLITPRRSPAAALAEHPGVLGHLTTDDPDPKELTAMLAEHPRDVVIAIDDAELVKKDCTASSFLKKWISTAGDAGNALLLAGGSAELGSGFSGWHAAARKGRCGIVICPQSSSDAEILGIRMNRSMYVDTVKTGTGYLHTGDGALHSITLAHLG